MRIINVPRGDVSKFLHSPVMDTSMVTFGNMSSDVLNSGIFGNYVQQVNNYYQSDYYLNLANELASYKSYENLDISIYLINSENISVGRLMQEYIMASPYISNAYDTGLITGYVNALPKDYNLPYQERMRYDQVMDGITHEVENEDVLYSTDIISGNPEYLQSDLELDQQMDIQATWEYMKRRIFRGIDPTE